MSSLDIKHTIVFSKNLKAFEEGKRFILNQGGSRSSKTYSIIQLLIYLCLVNRRLSVSVVRKTFPALRGSVLRDFIEIMNDLGLYNVNNHNKTEQRYMFSNGSSFEFFSVDDSQKIKGRKRDICYCNEGNELTREDYLQLNMRTTKCLFIDYNPSDNENYLYELINDEGAILIKSTYLDNIYLGDEIKKEIANLINEDENYYKIYALGERPIPNTRIYTHFNQHDNEPILDDWCYGIDFGYNHPTCLLKVGWFDSRVYVKEEIYKSNLTSGDIIKEMNRLGIDKKKYIYADYARPEIIEDLRRAGYNMKEAIKDVKEGIMCVKTSKISIHKESLNVWKEFKMYSWKTNKEQILDEPVKLYDDCFTGETLISTINGKIPIKDINVNDLVLTSNGFKRVLLKHNIGMKPVKKYRIQCETNGIIDDIIVSSTPEHKIKTNIGWIPISKLQSGQIIYLNKTSMVNHINATQEESILHNTNSHYTELFGNTSMEKYQKDIISITKMEILGITIQKILNVLKVKNIYRNIINKKILRNFKRQELKQPKNGIKVKKELNGIKNKVKNLGIIENIKRKSVKNVIKNTQQDIAVYPDFAITTANLKVIEEIESCEEKVYDITVEDNHEYFANGILVHNCMDALRYAIYTSYKKKNSSNKLFYTIR